jgi:hypothetical protein
MKHCEHSHWLSLSSQGNYTYLEQSDRLRTITKYIPNPHDQKPSLFVLIGNAGKPLKELFGIRNRQLKKKRSAGDVHLHIDPSSIFNERPIIIADTDIGNIIPKAKGIAISNCHEVTYRPIQITNYASICQLLSPFADVFCFYSEDLEGIARYLATWSEYTTLPESPRPLVLIVTEKAPNDVKRALVEARSDLPELVSGIEIITPRHRFLKERLMDVSDRVRKSREEAHMLFSASHLEAFLRASVETFANLFSFITVSRAHNPMASDIEDHISCLLGHIKSPKELIEFAAPTIASSILLDCYPPNSHRKT